MNDCIIENIAVQITSYECDTVEVFKIIKTDITNDMFKHIENINELSMI